MKRRPFQPKGRYFWLSISFALVPFLLFRVAVFYNVTFRERIDRPDEVAWNEDKDCLQDNYGGREFQGFKHSGEHQEDDRQFDQITGVSDSLGLQEMVSTAKMAKTGGEAEKFPADLEAQLIGEDVHDITGSESASNELEREVGENRKVEDEEERKLKEEEQRKLKEEEERKLKEEEKRELREEEERKLKEEEERKLREEEDRKFKEEEERKLKEEEERRRAEEEEREKGEREARKRRQEEEEDHRRKDEVELKNKEEFVLVTEETGQLEQRKIEEEDKSPKKAEEVSHQARNEGSIKNPEEQPRQKSDPNPITEVTSASVIKTWDGGQKEDRTSVKEEETTGHKSSNEESKPAEVVLTRDEKLLKISNTRPGDCSLHDGDWEYDEAGPLYTNDTCPYIQHNQDCLKNGRPDRRYLHYRWKPRDCDLPRFTAEAFMQTFKGKTVGFVGDSLARNQMQSLLCMLTQVEKPIVVYNVEYVTFKYRFEEHQVNLIVVWAPYLVTHSGKSVEGYDLPDVLYMDVLDSNWTSRIPEMDVMVVSIGQWYFRPMLYVKEGGKEVVGCYQCPHLPNVTEIGFLPMVREAVRLGLEKITSELKGVAILHTVGPQHYEHGGWETGWCRREKPIEAEEVPGFGWMNEEMRDATLDEFTRAFEARSQGDGALYLDFIDILKVNLLRADGHPGPYRQPYPYAHRDSTEWVLNDCLHWCMPGPVDTWNQILLQIAKRYL